MKNFNAFLISTVKQILPLKRILPSILLRLVNFMVILTMLLTNTAGNVNANNINPKEQEHFAETNLGSVSTNQVNPGHPLVEPADGPACVQEPDGLVDWWPADGNAQDLVGGHNGELINGTAFVQGKFGQAFNFDGSNDYINLGSWFTLQDFSISIWINQNSDQRFYANIIDNNNWKLERPGWPHSYPWGNTSIEIPDGQWHFLVISHNSNGFSSYLDGTFLGTSGDGTINYTNPYLRLGTSNYDVNRNWKGLLDEIKVYSPSLSASQVTAIYGAGNAGTCVRIDSRLSTVEVPSAAIVANNSDTATIHVTVKGQNGAVLPNHTVSINVSGSGNSIVGDATSVQTDQNGVADFQLKSSRAEVKTITITDSDNVTLESMPAVTFIPGPLSLEHSTITVNPAQIPADGTTQANVTVSALDAFDNPISGRNVDLSASGTHNVVIDPTSPTDANGQTTGSITGNGLETATISASIDGGQLPQTAQVQFRGTDLVVSQTASAPVNGGVSNDHATAGKQITYSLTLKNNGLMTANSVTLTDTLPDGLSFISQNSSMGFSQSGQTLTWQVGTLAAGEQKDIELVASISPNIRGTVTNTITAGFDPAIPDENPDNNTGQLGVIVEGASSAVRIASGTALLQAKPGTSSASLPFEIHNEGLDSTGALTIELPNHLRTWIQVSPSSLPAIVPGGSASMNLTANPDGNKAYGTYLGLLKLSDERGSQDNQLVIARVVPSQRAVKVTINNDQGTLVPGASLRLQNNASYTWVDTGGNESSYQRVYSGSADETGAVSFSSLDEGNYSFTLSAPYHQQLTGTLNITSGNGQQEETLTMTSLPGLYVEPGQTTLAVSAGEQASQTIRVKNTGTAKLSGVNVQLSGFPDWVQLLVPDALTELDPQEQSEFRVNAKAPAGTTSQWIMGQVLVSGTGASQLSVGLSIDVLSEAASRRDVRLIFVDQDAKSISTGGQVVVKRVKPGQMTVDQQTIPYQPQYSLPISADGTVLFQGNDQLEVGEEYAYQAWGENYQVTEGFFTVNPKDSSGQSQNQPLQANAAGGVQEEMVILKADHFIYSWKVSEVPGGIDIAYKIEVTITYEDGTPVSVQPAWCSTGCTWIWNGETGTASWNTGNTGTGGGSAGMGGPSLPPSVPLPRMRYSQMHLSQTAVLAWQAFHANLWLKNTSALPLEQMQIQVKVADALGADHSGDFILQPADTVQVESIASLGEQFMDWVIIPKGTSITQTTNFQVYAQIQYQLDGVSYTYSTMPQWIKVDPAPSLDIRYEIPDTEVSCLEFDIRALITNNGSGIAHNLRYDSLQPTTDDETTSFRLISAQVSGQSQNDPMNLSLGELAPGESRQVVWRIRASKPVHLTGASGGLQQAEGVAALILAIHSVTVKMVPSACLVSSIPRESTRDSGCTECEQAAYNGALRNVGGPINTLTGGMDYSYADLSFPVTAGTINFTRWYSTQAVDTFTTPLGYGWAHSLDHHLTLPTGENKIVKVKLSSTNEYLFIKNEDGSFTPYAGFFATLTKHSDNSVDTYQLVRRDGWVYTFDQNGKILSYLNPEKIGIVYTYSDSGYLTRVADNSSSRYLDITYDGTLIKEVQDYSGRKVSFEYDGDGNLITVHDVLNQKWMYTYDSHHRLTAVKVEVQENGQPVEKFVERTEFDDQGRAVRQFDGAGNKIVEVSYGTDGHTVVTGMSSGQQTYQYDARGTLVGEQQSDDRTQSYQYDSNFRITVQNDANGNKTQVKWSDDGAHLQKMTDAINAETSLTYEGDNLTIVQDALQNQTLLAYEDPAHPNSVTRQTDALGNRTSYAYNAGGQLLRVTNALGQQTEYTYDSFGQLATVTGAGQTTTYSYDNLGQIRSVKSPDGRTDWSCYDSAGRLVRSVKNASGNASSQAMDPCDQEHYVVSSDPQFDVITRQVYDEKSNQIAVIDADGKITRTYYDDANRPVTVVQNLTGQEITAGTPPVRNILSTEQNIRRDTLYDESGRAIATVDAIGIVSRTYFDDHGRVQYVTNNLQDPDHRGDPAASLAAVQSLNTPPGFDINYPDQNVTTQTVYDVIGNAIASVMLTPGCSITENQDGSLTVAEKCVVTRNYYDALNRVVASIQNLRGHDILDKNIPDRTTDANQNLRSDTVYDKTGNVIASINPAGVVTRTYYDALNRPQYEVQNLTGQGIDIPTPPGNDMRDHEHNLTTRMIYDAAGKQIATIQELPGCVVTGGSDGNGNPQTTVNDSCRVTRTYYDALGRAQQTVENLTGKAIEAGAANGFNPAAWDENVPGSQPRYDAAGRVIAQVDPLNHVTRTFYDAAGRAYLVTDNLKKRDNPDASVDDLLQLTSPDPFDLAHNDENLTSQTYYDHSGRVIATKDASGILTRTYYDAMGRQSKVTHNLTHGNESVADLLARSEPVGFNPEHSDQNVTTQMVYDAAGRSIATVVLTQGCVISQDSDGNVKATDACVVTRTYYDGLSRVVSEVKNLRGKDISASEPPDRLSETDPLQNLRTDTKYDARGRVIATLDPMGVISRTYYNDLGRAVKIVQNLSGQSYEKEDFPASGVEMNVSTDFVYDVAGRQTQKIDPKRNITAYEYDTLGRLKAVIENYHPGVLADAETNVRTEYTYDASGNRLTIRSGNAMQNSSQEVTTFSYDDLNRVKEESDPLQHRLQYTYDEFGRQYKLTAADGSLIEYHYDALSRLVWVDYPDPDVDVRYQYYPDGSRWKMEDGSGTTEWTLDRMNRVESVKNGAGVSVSYAYDSLGNRTKLSYPDPARVVSYSYDALSRLKQVTDWQGRVTGYTYDAASRVENVYQLESAQTSLERYTLKSEYVYDPLGQVQSMTHKTQEGMLSSFAYEYDANGNRTKAVETQQKATAAPAVFSVARQDFTSVSLTWPKDAAVSGYHLYRSSDNKANWTQIAGLSSTTTRYTDFGLPRETPLWYRLSPWDGSGEKQPSELSMETGFAPSIEPEFVSATIEYMYDALSRLKEANYADGNYFRYAYDANGNRLSETTPAGTVASVYDAANRLVSVGGVTYTWDNNGNLLSDGVNTYTYDHSNRLKSVTQGANVSTYAYNGDGDRVSQTVNGATTNYTLDLNAGLTQVLADNTTTYLYGLSRIGQFAGTDSAYFLGDALGSVRQMADSTGAVTLSRNYDPYGNVVTSQGSGVTAFGYTGEMQQGGLVYLRARYYQTSQGRFITQDSWDGDKNRPLSLNAWMYVEGNPINLTDPSGNTPIPHHYIYDPSFALLHFFGYIPDFEGLDIVDYYKSSFDMWEPKIKSHGLDKTTIAAAIAVQSEWKNYPLDMIKNMAYEYQLKGCDNPIVLWILNNKFTGQASVGYAKEHPSEKYGDLNIMSESIIAMTDRISKSTDNCPNCKPKDKLMIAGMAQNGGGFKFEIYQQAPISAHGFMKENGYIDWNLYFSNTPNLSGPLPANSPNNIMNNVRSGGRNYNSSFQLQLFTQDMMALKNFYKWDLPPEINQSILQDILDFAFTGNEK